MAAPTRASTPHRTPIRAVIFDLDGTLTAPLLDFAAIRRELAIAPGHPILEALEHFELARRVEAEEILRRREMEAIEAATLAPGCREVLAFLEARALPAAILTRNIRAAVEHFISRFGLRFAASFTREDGPAKPAPDGVTALCRSLAVAPSETLVVGDYRFDILAGRDAGCRTALVRSAGVGETVPLSVAQSPEWGPPDHVVDSLHALIPLLL
jgi:HAD superfamily hydrolase (TIGR01549 family)